MLVTREVFWAVAGEVGQLGAAIAGQGSDEAAQLERVLVDIL